MKKLAAYVLAALPLTLLVACGSNNPGTSNDVAAQRLSTALRFFEPMRAPETAVQPSAPETLRDAYNMTTATVLAKVKNVRPGRVIKGSAGDLQWVVVELNVLEVLNGALEPALNGKVEVEFAANWAPDPVDPIVQQMRADLPSEPSVWLLRWEGKPLALKPGAAVKDLKGDLSKYVLVHLEVGVFAEDNGVLTSATGTTEVRSRGARAEAEALRTIAALAENARKHR